MNPDEIAVLLNPGNPDAAAAAAGREALLQREVALARLKRSRSARPSRAIPNVGALKRHWRKEIESR